MTTAEQGSGQTTRLAVGPFSVFSAAGAPPPLYDPYCQRARTVHRAGMDDPQGAFWFVAVQADAPATASDAGWPFLVVAQRYHLMAGGAPGVALLPEAGRLFLGAGTRLLAFDLDPGAPRLLWEDGADYGFHRWQVTGDTVLMSAELELAAWDAKGTKRWTTFVEPPWEYRVLGEDIAVTVMGETAVFSLRAGPPAATMWWRSP